MSTPQVRLYDDCVLVWHDGAWVVAEVDDRREVRVVLDYDFQWAITQQDDDVLP